MNDPFDRYSRQVKYSPLGPEGQRRLSVSKALICGCGALGSMIAERLARAGVGSLRIVDRDWVELSNLQRQTLFTEEHARESTPKAAAAVQTLRSINGQIELEACVADVTYRNMSELAAGCDLILDGTDNFETRFLINDFALDSGTPWIHGGCLGASGQVLSIVPGQTACFRCLVPDLPPREALETCDTAGVLGPAIGVVASWQAAEALKVLSGNEAAVCNGLIIIDTWQSDCRIVKLSASPNCRACGAGELPFLSGDIRTEITVLCGKNAVQLVSALPPSTDEGATLQRLAKDLRGLGDVLLNPYFLRLSLPTDHTLTIFRGGRTVVEGTTDEAEAKSILARTLGS